VSAWGHSGQTHMVATPCPLRSDRVRICAARFNNVQCRLCSLIPGFGVKLSAVILAGPTVLSAVGACPPHGVRRRWWINVASAASLIESSQKIGRSHHRHRPGRDVLSRRAAIRQAEQPFEILQGKFGRRSDHHSLDRRLRTGKHLAPLFKLSLIDLTASEALLQYIQRW
jgi:hypothetical protein